jgi:hypothetical protein
MTQPASFQDLFEARLHILRDEAARVYTAHAGTQESRQCGRRRHPLGQDRSHAAQAADRIVGRDLPVRRWGGCIQKRPTCCVAYQPEMPAAFRRLRLSTGPALSGRGERRESRTSSSARAAAFRTFGASAPANLRLPSSIARAVFVARRASNSSTTVTSFHSH